MVERRRFVPHRRSTGAINWQTVDPLSYAAELGVLEVGRAKHGPAYVLRTLSETRPQTVYLFGCIHDGDNQYIQCSSLGNTDLLRMEAEDHAKQTGRTGTPQRLRLEPPPPKRRPGTLF